MEILHERRPRVSRETRYLIAAACLALAVLWVLARFRVTERLAGPANISQGVFAPFTSPARFEDLAKELADVSERAGPSLLSLRLSPSASPRAEHVTALRVRDDLGVVLLEPGRALEGDGAVVLARDAATGLAVVRVAPGPSSPFAPSSWAEGRAPRYVLQAVSFPGRTSLLPLTLAGITAIDAPLWRARAWQPASPPLTPGAFLFTPEGEWVGLVGLSPGMAIVPAPVVSRQMERLLNRGERHTPTWLGIDVHALTPALQRATGAAGGVVVAFVDDRGPAAGRLRIGDVLQGAAGDPLPSVDHWRRFFADLEGSPVPVSLLRAGTMLEVIVSPAPAPVEALPAAVAPVPEWGATARFIAGVGSLVTGVTPGSLAAAADLRVGDVVTHVGDVAAPTPARLRAVVEATPSGQPVLVAARRAGQHIVTVVER